LALAGKVAIVPDILVVMVVDLDIKIIFLFRRALHILLLLEQVVQVTAAILTLSV